MDEEKLLRKVSSKTIRQVNDMELTDNEQLEVNEFSTKYPTIYKMMQVQIKNMDTIENGVEIIAELQTRMADSLIKMNKKIDNLENEVSRLKKHEPI